MILTKKGSHRIADFKCELCGEESSKTYVKKSFKPMCTKCILGRSQFATKATTLHKGKYNYDTVVYRHSLQKVNITCFKHGVFTQTPSMHLHGQGCPGCGKESMGRLNSISTDIFIKDSINKFTNLFTYECTDYVRNNKPIQIRCIKHGVFITIPTAHLTSKTGMCPRCNPKYVDTKIFIDRCTVIHTGKYTYGKTIYNNARSSVVVTCPTHGDFMIGTSPHLNGRGCVACAKYGFDPNIPGKLYYVYLPKYNLYKIGITNRELHERFPRGELTKMKVVWVTEFTSGYLTRSLEQSILKRYKKYQYKGEPILYRGNTELFTQDIFNVYDYSIPQLATGELH